MEIDLVNSLYPYVGQYNSAGLDKKNRIVIPNDLLNILNRRKKAFGLEDELVYYSLKTHDSALLVVRDYLLNTEDSPYFYPYNVDSQNRMRISGNLVNNLLSRRDLVCIGYVDHIRIYSRSDWEKLQANKQ